MNPPHLVFCVVLVLTTLAQTVSATNAQNPGLKIVVIAGEDAVNVVQQKTAVAPIVEVRDRNNLPVAGATVTFAIGGNSATFAGGSQVMTLVTNASGRAVAAAISPLTSGTVPIQVTAAFQGQTAAAVITQSNVITAAQQAGAAASSNSGAAVGGGISGKTFAIVGGVAAAAGGGYAASTLLKSPPVVDELGASPEQPFYGARVTFLFGLSVNGNTDEATVRLEYGDGTSQDLAVSDSGEHIYAAPGNYTVRATVTRSDGKSGSLTFALSVGEVTGRWIATATNFGTLAMELRQSGSSIAGTYSVGNQTGNVTGRLLDIPGAQVAFLSLTSASGGAAGSIDAVYLGNGVFSAGVGLGAATQQVTLRRQ